MKKVRMLLVVASLASASIVVSATPASAKCVGDPVNPCVIVCSVGQSNKYTEKFFEFCNVI
jgi:hypothetical protein